jgi:Fe-S cluster assembly scaffold protein SufB
MQLTFQQYLEETQRGLPPTSVLWDKQRRLALDHFFSLGFPSVNDESWRYIARSPMLQQPFKIAALPNAMLSDFDLSLPAPSQPATLRLVCLNGQFYLPSVLPPGLKIEPIHQAMVADPVVLASRDFQVAKRLGHSFNALNTAFSHAGVSIVVADGFIIEPLIELWYVSSGWPSQSSELMMLCLKNDINVGKNSSVKMVEYSISLDNDRERLASSSLCMNVLTTLTMDAGAETSWAQSIRAPEQDIYLGQLVVQQYRNSQFHSESLVLGGGLVRHTLSVDLCEPEAACELVGLTGVKRRHQVDHQVVIDHQADNTNSHIHYRAIADDKGCASFSGEVAACHGIQGMHSHQGNYNLLLSDQAEIHTRPRLTLLAADIQCTHGATVGALDPEALFYLQARGLSEQVARLLLIQGFSQAIVDKMPLCLSSQTTLPNDLITFICDS